MICEIGTADIFSSSKSKSLITEYAAECSIPLIGQVNPQPALYAALENAGALRCLGSFNGKELEGFATVLITPNPHYGQLIGMTESLFLAKTCRNSSKGRELLSAAESHARNKGCPVFGCSAPVGSQFEKLLTLLRPYVHTNSIFMRQL